MEYKLKEVISREPTLLVMVVGVPNVGKSALINSIHQIASSRFPGEFIMLVLGAAFMNLILLEKRRRREKQLHIIWMEFSNAFRGMRVFEFLS